MDRAIEDMKKLGFDEGCYTFLSEAHKYGWSLTVTEYRILYLKGKDCEEDFRQNLLSFSHLKQL